MAGAATRQLDLIVRLARDGERRAAERLRSAQTRLEEAEARLASISGYVQEYGARRVLHTAQSAARLQQEQRFLLELERTVNLQTGVLTRSRQQLDAARAAWADARRRREALEALRDERRDAAARRQSAIEQQRLDDRPAGVARWSEPCYSEKNAVAAHGGSSSAKQE